MRDGRPAPRPTSGRPPSVRPSANRPADRWCAGRRIPLPSALLAATLLALAACGPRATPVVLVATTTTHDSGLLDELARAYERTHPDHALKVVAVGTGEALALGRRGDADVLLVHAPDAERAFLRAGHGVGRTPVMENRFVLVGPPADPAGAARAGSVAAALRTVARARAPFVSRGDDSGTHRRERALWRAAGVEPSGGWYREVGQGMAETLRYADQEGAYTLSVSANFLVLRDRLALRVLADGGPRTENVYSVVRPADSPHPDAAPALARWLAGPEARRVIADFGRERHGRPLFRPVAGGAGEEGSGP